MEIDTDKLKRAIESLQMAITVHNSHEVDHNDGITEYLTLETYDYIDNAINILKEAK